MKAKIVIPIISVAVLAAGFGFWALFHSNTSPTTKAPSAKNDTTAPVIQLNVPESSVLLSQENESLQIAIKTTKFSDIDRVVYLLDGNIVARSTDAPFIVTIDIKGLSVGQHTLQAYAYDNAGNVGKSEIFTFTITEENKPVVASDQTSTSIIRQSLSNDALKKSVSNEALGSSGSSGNNGGDNGGDNGDGDGDGDTTPWPDTAADSAIVCGASMLNGGPTSAPAGAITVPAGSNAGFDFAIPGATYWFAPGMHKLDNTTLGQIIPEDGATYIGAPGAILDGQGVNESAFTQHAVGVTIKYLTIKNFNTPRDQGTVNHDSGVGWTFEYNTLEDNAGGALFLGTNNVAKNNCLRNNGQYGFQVYSSDPGGPHNVLLDHNEISGNNTDDWESVIDGCGCTGGGKFWEATNVTITNNYVHDNLSVGLWADTNDNDFLVEGNYISDNQAQGLFYEISYNMIVRNNNFVHNAVDSGPNNDSFPTGAIYLSESGGDNRVAGRTANIDIYDNNFDDNWAGVILWENADRFCNSPANTSSGTCTMVNPAANLTTCNDPALGGSIDQQPYKSDCRWKTQNVKVHNNIFKTTTASIPGCDNGSSCGYQGVFSNVGTFPSWSPYKGSGIQNDITFNQNNIFSSNTYLGDWRFKGKEQSSSFNFAVWQSTPFNQDVGSTYNGQNHLVVTNAIDTDTATLEGSIGQWDNWFSASVSQSTAEAHTGTHSLKVNITAPFGWGALLTDSKGPAVTTTPKDISYWVKLGSGTNLKSRLEVKWLDENGDPVVGATDVLLVSPVITNTWQKVSTTLPVTPPTGTRYANIHLVSDTGTGGSAGNVIYFDDFVIGDAQ